MCFSPTREMLVCLRLLAYQMSNKCRLDLRKEPAIRRPVEVA